MAQQLHMVRSSLRGLGKAIPPPGYHLRTYSKGDEESWAGIMNNSLGEGWDVERCRRELTARPQFRPGGLYFATHKNKPIGTACAWTTAPDESEMGSIHMVGVLPEHRGKKLGYVLCLSVLHFFRENGFQTAQLRTDDFRLPAIKTYLDLGFEPDYMDESHRKRWNAILEKLAYRNE